MKFSIAFSLLAIVGFAAALPTPESAELKRGGFDAEWKRVQHSGEWKREGKSDAVWKRVEYAARW